MASYTGFSKRNRRRKLVLRLSGVAAVGLAAWLGGLFWFAAALETDAEADRRKTDAIVVLTGGTLRVEQGIDLLSEGLAEKLFVSGVARGIDVKKLLEVFRRAPEDLSCCIALGYDADDTAGNARETATWMRGQNYSSLRLVTAAYHMPRSLLEFRRTMPDTEIVAHPVFPAHVKQRNWWLWPGSASLMVSEYNKYLFALARATLIPAPS